jgi:hypothetical protein
VVVIIAVLGLDPTIRLQQMLEQQQWQGFGQSMRPHQFLVDRRVT